MTANFLNKMTTKRVQIYVTSSPRHLKILSVSSRLSQCNFQIAIRNRRREEGGGRGGGERERMYIEDKSWIPELLIQLKSRLICHFQFWIFQDNIHDIAFFNCSPIISSLIFINLHLVFLFFLLLPFLRSYFYYLTRCGSGDVYFCFEFISQIQDGLTAATLETFFLIMSNKTPPFSVT